MKFAKSLVPNRQCRGSALISMRIRVLGQYGLRPKADGQNCKNFSRFKKNQKILFFGQAKITSDFPLGLHEERPSYKRRLQHSKDNIRSLKS
jgi:hypothetical protein